MNPILSRLDSVANDWFGSRPNLARAIGKKPDIVTGYFTKDSVPGGEFLALLNGVGISTDWLLTGEGEMFADNEAGEALKAKHPPQKETKEAQSPNQEAHKWALVREWLTETGTMAEWYFMLKQAIGKLPIDYVLWLEGKAPEPDKNTIEWYSRQIFNIIEERGIDLSWLLDNDDEQSQFTKDEAGEALKARWKK